MGSDIVIVVDLDGTLINTDLLHETSLRAIRQNPLNIFYMLFWALQGKAVLKANLAKVTSLDVSLLPFNQDLIYWLREQKENGRRIVLSTASDASLANKISHYLGLFDEVIASDGVTNNAGSLKAKLLLERFGETLFDYIGNSVVDLLVWKYSRKAVVVNGSPKLLINAKKICNVDKVFPRIKPNLNTWLKVFRLHQWIKNSLLFVPAIAAHQFGIVGEAQLLVFSFLAFSLCASAVYILNDLLDLESDRQHPRKCKRPFASGAVPIWHGLFLSSILIFGSIYLSKFVLPAFFPWLIIYFFITCLYSIWLKRIVLIDCLVLAILYTLRIVAGGAAIGVMISFWLLAFSVFLFFSLAFIKRFAELISQHVGEESQVQGRGYLKSDTSVIKTLGISSGLISVLILSLYLNSPDVLILYKKPEIIWAAIPLMLLWISWLWLKAGREEMHDDPIIFAIKDRVSILIGLSLAIVFLVAGFWSA
jgi:4-hydroxybenzoate polyprenyltransferase